jgi:hypothetical protein
MKPCILSIVLFLTVGALRGQELNCKISIIKEASLEVNSTELEIFKEPMDQRSVYDRRTD